MKETLLVFEWLKRSSLAMLLVATMLAGCTVRPKEALETRTLLPQEAVDTQKDAVPVGVETVSPSKGDGVHTVLALSSGGTDGAYGAGVLAGLTASGNRPEFDIVTGVSTGALLSVFAFLGPEYDALIKKLYTTQTSKDIYRSKGVGGVFTDSLYDNEPLKQQIAKVVTSELLADVAREHAKGRRLYVATTNLDAGELIVWDMGKIAQGGRTDPLLHFQKVLRASAAIPAFFQPVYIKPQRGVQLRQAHVDGGVKEPILVNPGMLESDLPTHLYMVVNGSLKRLNASAPVEPKLISIAQKTISEMMRELIEDTIYRDYVESREVGAKFFLTAIPNEVPIALDPLEFDQKRMRKIYDLGFKAGKSGPKSWLRQPPGTKPQRDRRIAAN